LSPHDSSELLSHDFLTGEICDSRLLRLRELLDASRRSSNKVCIGKEPK
jgi:hypothetical protein